MPVEAEFTRDFVPEIEILQRERDFDSPAWMWGVANLVVLLCSLAIIVGISVAVVPGLAQHQRPRGRVRRGRAASLR